MLIKDVMDYLEQIVPKNLAESWDNVGLLVGDKNREVNKVLLALDVTEEVVEEAIKLSANLIITHHPLIFKAVKTINTDDFVGSTIIKLIKNDIAIYTLHTNLDSGLGGTNDVLADLLEIKNKQVLLPSEVDNNCGLGRYGDITETTVENLLKFMKSTNKFDYINYSLDNKGMNKLVKKIGLCTGSVMDSLIYKSKSLDCDVYVTGDVTYHTAQIAKRIGITIIDVGHYCSENLVLESMEDKLKKEFNNINIKISNVNAQTIFSY